MQQLPPYLFGMINRMKTEKRLKGDDVIDLGMGNPVDPTPVPIVQKLCEVAQGPKSHRYPLAMDLRNLRKEIAKSYRQEYGITLNSETEVICTHRLQGGHFPSFPGHCRSGRYRSGPGIGVSHS